MLLNADKHIAIDWIVKDMLSANRRMQSLPLSSFSDELTSWPTLPSDLKKLIDIDSRF